MSQTTTSLQPDQRDALIGQIVRRLNMLDDHTLAQLAQSTREPTAPPEVVADTIEQTISRRRFMLALLGSGVVATTAGTVTAWQWGAEHGEALSARIEQLSSTIKRLWGLVDLYSQLDAAPLESVATAGIEAFAKSLHLAQDAARVVRAGVQSVEEALRRFEAGFPKIRESLAWLDGVLADWSGKLRLLEDAIGRTLDEVSPVTQALGAFFETVLKWLPFGMGDKAREVADRIGELIASIPQVSESISLNILTPLREEWFSDDKGRGLKAWLVEPLITRLLDPLEALMDSVAGLDADLARELDGPIREAIRQRAALRQQISEYRELYRLQEPAA